MKLLLNWLLFLCVPLFFAAGCVSMGTGEGDQIDSSLDTIHNSAPKVSLFVSLKSTEGPHLTANINEVELYDGEKWVSIIGKPIILDSKNIDQGQILAARSNIPVGNYSQIRFSVQRADLGRGNTKKALTDIVQALPQELSPSLMIDNGDSTSLFMEWDTNASLGDKRKRFEAKIQTAVQTISLTTELAYVSCPEINTVYIIRTDSNRITGSWGISGYPSYLTAFKDNDELYVLANKEDSVKIIELSSGRLKDSIRVPLVTRPFFMVTDTNGDNAYILDKGSNFVTKIDMNTGALGGRVRLAERPGQVIYLGEKQQIAVTSPISQTIYLLDANSLKINNTISVNSRPAGMLYFNNKLYVAESESNTIMSFNMNNSNIERSHVGLEPKQFAEQNNYIYVSNHADGTVSVLLPDQLSVVKNIRVGGYPLEMSNSALRNWLYVNDSKGKRITVVDATSHRLAATIELESQPFDIDIIQ